VVFSIYLALPKIDKTKSAEGGQRGRRAAAHSASAERQKGKIFVP